VRLGITAALTDLDVTPAALAAAIEEIGFDSFWLPEHTHLPVREDVPPALVEGVRLDDYKRCLDPLIALATAAAVTERIGLGTGILLAAQHDPIVLAKSVATLDHLSGGRVTLGVGVGWNRAEAEDHGVDFGRRWFVVREHLAPTERERAWTMVEDPVMARGGCQVSTNTSRIDMRLETRLGAILSELLGTERSPSGARGGSGS